MTELSPNKLFHAIVMLGTAAGVACGGNVEPPPTFGDPTNETERTGGSSSGSGGAEASGGASGGALQLGSTGGSGGTSWSVDWLSEQLRNCPPEQWSCPPDATQSCSDALLDPTLCHCDTTRPTSADQCPDGTTFVCQRLTLLPIDDEDRAIDCACLAEESACSCPARNWSSISGCLSPTPPESVLCGGCSAILLK